MLSRRQAEILSLMVAAEDEERWEDAEIVRDGGSCWIGDERTSPATVDVLLAHVCVGISDGSTDRLQRYTLTGTGRLAAADPSVAERVRTAVLRGEPCDEAGFPLAAPGAN